MRRAMFRTLAILLLFIGLIGFVKYRQISMAIAQGRSFKPPPETVTTVTARVEPWESTVEAVGSVAPVQGVLLSADQPGTVARISFVSGARVRAGQALVELDTREERAQLAAAQAQLALAKTNLDRSKALLERQLVAQADYDQQLAQYRQADANVNALSAAIERKIIRAPFAGTAGIRQVNLGQYVHSGDPVVPLQSMDRVYVDFAVPQQQVATLHLGDQVHAAPDTGAAAVEGRVTAVNPVVDEATRNVQVQATFPNPGARLRAGMYVTVRVGLGESRPVIALPASAIAYAPYGNSVFVVETMKGPGGATYRGVRQQFVKLGAARGDQVAVLDGLKPGQEVVSSGVFKLRTGAAVRVDNRVRPGNSLTPRPPES